MNRNSLLVLWVAFVGAFSFACSGCDKCTQDCGSRQCGPVPNCGGLSCGTCYGDTPTCNEEGLCVGECSPNCPGDHLWSKGFGGSDYDEAKSIAVDPGGNLLVAGYFSNAVSFGGEEFPSVGGNDIFVAKFDPNGNHLWSKAFGTVYWEEPSSITADSLGNVFLTGGFWGFMNFGGEDLVGGGVFVAKFDGSGNHLWSKRFGGSFGFEHRNNNLAVDPNGNVWLTGSYTGTVNFGGKDLVGGGVFVAKFDARGNHLWSKRFGGTDGPGVVHRPSIAVDSAGNVSLMTVFHGTVDFGGGKMTSIGRVSDIVVSKYEFDGNHLWSKQFATEHFDRTNSIAADSDGNVLMTGGFGHTVNFGGEDLNCAGYQSFDIFVAKFDSNGNHLWSKRFGGAGYDEAKSIAADSGGNVLVTGAFSNSTNFGGGDLTSAGEEDIFVAEFDSNGNHLWSKRFGASSPDYGYSTATDSDGNVTVAGYFQGNVNFGGGVLKSAGRRDIFVVKLKK